MHDIYMGRIDGLYLSFLNSEETSFRILIIGYFMVGDIVLQLIILILCSMLFLIPEKLNRLLRSKTEPSKHS